MQMSIFDGEHKFKIDKPIRLIELFSGYGSQALALKYLGVSFEHYRIAEWAVKSIQAYKDMHFAEDTNDYSKDLFINEIIDFLYSKGISANYNEPMTYEQIKRLGESRVRTIFNNIKATHNLVSVCNIKGEDLGIVNTDKYDYILTYSFPCQDLSNAGKKLGMDKDGGTRSGLLWEVMNGIDFGIPQHRKRCFMVSILGNYNYSFINYKFNSIALREIFEHNVKDKFYYNICPSMQKAIENGKCFILNDKGYSSAMTCKIDRWNNVGFYKDKDGLRYLTPRECFRLMGVKDEDFERVTQNQTRASLYHLAGDSIIVNVLISIFKEMIK